MTTSSPRYTPLAGGPALDHADASAYDRRWLLIDDEGNWIADAEQLAPIEVDIRFGFLVLRAPGMLRLDIPLDVIEDDDSVRGRARVENQEIDVVDEGAVAARWMSTCLGRTCRLVKVHPDADTVSWPAD